MLVMCAACGRREAVTDENLCANCYSERSRTSVMPVAAAALSTTALLIGATVLAERMLRGDGEGGGPFGWSGRFRPQASILANFARDLTAEAAEGRLDPVVGRDEEIERVVAILARRSKNNPVLLGEPGVGKTAIVEGLATRIAQNRIPASLQGKRVLSLSVAKLVAGTKFRGEFENRVKRLLDEIHQASREIVLFVDELHLLVGAGGAEGALDLSSMLKPELARGELQCIGATTFEEYRKYIEVDAALERRFQPVTIVEPSVDATVEILRALRERYARHHNVTINDEALEAAAVLAARYVVERNLPDKAIDLMDEAASAAALSGTAVVTPAEIASVVAKWTGIPISSLTQTQSSDLLALETRLSARVIGQPEAIEKVAQSVRRSRAGLKDPHRPVGSFLFYGPSGVGKTELARALAEVLFGDADALVRIDLSEYTEAHSVSRLIGAPPGYAGHDEAGLLSEPVRRRPYSVVLLDEIEKAHADTASLMLSLLDSGRLTDAKGRVVEFRHAIVIMTSNLDRKMLAMAARPELVDRIDESIEFRPLLRPDVERIVELRLTELRSRLTGRNISLTLDDGARRVLAEHSMSGSEGARNVARTISRLVTNPLSTAILRGDVPEGASVTLRGGSNTVELSVR